MLGGLGKPTTWLPLLCFLLEAFALTLVGVQMNSSCIEGHEISVNVGIYVMCTFPYMMPDLFLVILVFFSDTITIRPFAVIYNAVAAFFILIGSIILFVGLTFCGNIAQIFFLVAGILTTFSAIFHVITIFAVRPHIEQGAPFAKKY